MPWQNQGGFNPAPDPGPLGGPIFVTDISDAGPVARTSAGSALSILGGGILQVDITKQPELTSGVDSDFYLFNRAGLNYRISKLNLFAGINSGGFSGTFDRATGLANGTGAALTNANTTSGQWWYATTTGTYDFGGGVLSMVAFDFVVRNATGIVIIPNGVTPSGVTTFEGRSGVVTSSAGDYDSDEITNASTVVGSTVGDALENLNVAIAGLNINTKATKGGDTDGAPVAIGTLDGFPVILRSNGINRLVLDGAGGVQFPTVGANAAPTRFAVFDGAGNLFYRDLAGVVTSFEGRTGAVVSVAGDYAASEITNNSAATGATVDLALTGLNSNKVTKGGDVGPLVIGTNDATTLTFETNNLARLTVNVDGSIGIGATANETATAGLFLSAGIIRSRTIPTGLLTQFNGRAGIAIGVTGGSNIVPAANDYSSSLITNLSALTGVTVTDALNNLNSQITNLPGPVTTLAQITDAGSIAATDPGVALSITGTVLNLNYVKQPETIAAENTDHVLVLRGETYYRISRSNLFAGIDAAAFSGTFNPATGLDSAGNAITNANTTFGQWWYAAGTGTYNFGAGVLNINTFDFLVRNQTVIEVIPNAGSPSGVTTFEGRSGIVTSSAGDYNSTEITNASTVPGATVTLALQDLGGDIATNAGAIATLTSTKATKGGDTDGAGLTLGTNDAFPLTLRANSTNLITLNSAGTIALSGVAEDAAQTRMLTLTPGTGVVTYRNYPNLLTAFNGRTVANVVPTAGDYTSTLITNASGVAGATVSAALNQLDTDIAAIVTGQNFVTRGGDTLAAPLTVGTNDAQPLTLETANAPRIVLGAAGEVTINGLAENVLGSQYVKRDPATGRIYATPVVDAILFDVSELPLTTWVSATTVNVGVGVTVCRSTVDSNSKRIWSRPIGIAPITAALPGGVVAGATVYLFACTNGTGDGSTDSAFFSTTNPPNNTPVGFNWVRHIASFVLNGSAQLNPFLMDGERWITGNFARETFIAGAGWASKVIPGCPLGSVEVFGIASAGLPTDGGFYSIRITTTNPTTAAIAAPSSSNGAGASTFDGNMSAYFISPSDVRPSTSSFFGVAENAGLWNIKNGSAYLNADTYPTLRLLKYRTALKVLS